MDNPGHVPPPGTTLKPSSPVLDPLKKRLIGSRSTKRRTLKGVRLLPKPVSKSIQPYGGAHTPHTFFFVGNHSVTSQLKRQDQMKKINSHAQSVARQARIQRLKGSYAASLVGGFSRQQTFPSSLGSMQSLPRSPTPRGASPREGLGAFPSSRVRSPLASGSSPVSRSGSALRRRPSPMARGESAKPISRTYHKPGRKELGGIAPLQHISNPSGPTQHILRLQGFPMSPTSFLDSGLIDPFANASTRMNKKMNGYLRFCKFYHVH